MNWLATLKIWALTAMIVGALPCRAGEFDAVDGPNVRCMKFDDGSREIFTRSPDNKNIVKKKVSPNGVLTMLTHYRMDASGNPLGCKIQDGQKQELFKVSYGYHKVTGLLERELMFDSRVKRIDKNTGKETPVQVTMYIYDAQGKRSAPVVYNLLPGKTFEQVFGVKSSALDKNPFSDGKP
jgi:hypothetical protein